ncbi:MAG: LrgB family protein [Lachnospiraceae bacterium]|nr:LrgB family protein [Lachnospiraceae bacterium]
MRDFLCNSVYFGVTISLGGYALGLMLKKRWKCGICNPLLISVIVTIIAILLLGVDYESYNQSAQYLSYLLTPATVCLAIPLYQQIVLLKKNMMAILLGIIAGVLSSLGSVLALSFVFGLEHEYYVTLLPKSITTAIGMGVSEELGGIVTITVAVILITGIFGNVMGETICKLFHIYEPIAVGLAFGTSSHAVGTAKALELGEIEGAMSSLSIAVAGILTVIGASIFATFL